MPQNGTALRHEEMTPGSRVIDIRRDAGRKIALDITVNRRFHQTGQLRRPWGQGIFLGLRFRRPVLQLMRHKQCRSISLGQGLHLGCLPLLGVHNGGA